MLGGTVFFTVLVVYAAIGLGALSRRIGWMTREADGSILALVVNLLTPCLIGSNILGSDAFADARNLYATPLLGFATIAGGIVVCWLIMRVLPKRLTALDTPTKLGSFAAAAGVMNYGYVPIPLLAELFPGDDRVLAVLFVFNLGGELALWTVCVAAVSGNFNRGTFRNMLSVPTVAILTCLLLNVTGFNRFVPGPVMKTLALLGPAAIPLSLLYVGATLYDRFAESDFSRHLFETARIGFFSVALRLVALPAAILLAARFLPVSREIKIVLAVNAAMASAIFPIVLAKLYGGDTDVALKTVLTNTLVGVVTTPLWLVAGLRWLGI